MSLYNDVLIELQDYILNKEIIQKSLQIKCLSLENNKNLFLINKIHFFGVFL